VSKILFLSAAGHTFVRGVFLGVRVEVVAFGNEPYTCIFGTEFYILSVLEDFSGVFFFHRGRLTPAGLLRDVGLVNRPKFNGNEAL
jgi:hypothetical protein